MPDGDREGTRSFAVSLLLSASGMMFGALVLLYLILRADAPVWPPEGSRPISRSLPSLASGAIVLSSLTMWLATNSLRQAKLRSLPLWLAATLALGGIFLGLVLWLWQGLIQEGFSSQNPHGGMFYVMTSFHGLHVLTAMSLLFWLFRGARRGRYHGRQAVAVRMVGRLWHFLGLCWALIYFALFVL